MFSRLAPIKEYIDSSGASSQLKKALYLVLTYLSECEPNTEQFYYHYFTHQNFGLNAGENISDSSMAVAANKELLAQQTAILNIPVSLYCKRPNISVIRSPYNADEKDVLVNIACYNTAIKIAQFQLLHTRVKAYLSNNETFESFSSEYHKFINSFDFSSWKPKTKLANSHVLDSAAAFPASSNETIKGMLDSWQIVNGSYEDNVASYKKLGGLVLEIHGYVKNSALSSHYHWDIYEAGYGNEKILVSIDTENGAFEVIDRSGTHIGVYIYDGTFLSHYTDPKDINSHSLGNIPQHMFIFT